MTLEDIVAQLEARGLMVIVRTHLHGTTATLGDVCCQGKPTLTAEKLRRAIFKDMLALGMSLSEVGKVFGRNGSTVHRVAYGRRRKAA